MPRSRSRSRSRQRSRSRDRSRGHSRERDRRQRSRSRRHARRSRSRDSPPRRGQRDRSRHRDGDRDRPHHRGFSDGPGEQPEKPPAAAQDSAKPAEDQNQAPEASRNERRPVDPRDREQAESERESRSWRRPVEPTRPGDRHSEGQSRGDRGSGFDRHSDAGGREDKGKGGFKGKGKGKPSGKSGRLQHETVFSGTIKNYNEDRGFGFIKPDDAPPDSRDHDLFFHIESFEGAESQLKPRTRVTFVKRIDNNGKDKAHGVRVEDVDPPAVQVSSQPMMPTGLAAMMPGLAAANMAAAASGGFGQQFQQPPPQQFHQAAEGFAGMQPSLMNAPAPPAVCCASADQMRGTALPKASGAPAPPVPSSTASEPPNQFASQLRAISNKKGSPETQSQAAARPEASEPGLEPDHEQLQLQLQQQQQQDADDAMGDPSAGVEAYGADMANDAQPQAVPTGYSLSGFRYQGQFNTVFWREDSLTIMGDDNPTWWTDQNQGEMRYFLYTTPMDHKTRICPATDHGEDLYKVAANGGDRGMALLRNEDGYTKDGALRLIFLEYDPETDDWPASMVLMRQTFDPKPEPPRPSVAGQVLLDKKAGSAGSGQQVAWAKDQEVSVPMYTPGMKTGTPEHQQQHHHGKWGQASNSSRGWHNNGPEDKTQFWDGDELVCSVKMPPKSFNVLIKREDIPERLLEKFHVTLHLPPEDQRKQALIEVTVRGKDSKGSKEAQQFLKNLVNKVEAQGTTAEKPSEKVDVEDHAEQKHAADEDEATAAETLAADAPAHEVPPDQVPAEITEASEEPQEMKSPSSKGEVPSPDTKSAKRKAESESTQKGEHADPVDGLDKKSLMELCLDMGLSKSGSKEVLREKIKAARAAKAAQ